MKEKAKGFLKTTIYMLVGIVAMTTSALAATTISTNIQTDGTLSVSGSSTFTGRVVMGNASTTLLTVSDTASTSRLIVSGAGGVAGCATFSSTGAISNTGSPCGGSGGSSYPFTNLSNFGTQTAASSTPLWAQNGLFASSTSYFVNAYFTIATTSYLVVSSAGAGCAQFNALGQLTSTGGACGTGSATTDFSFLQNFASTTAATTTPVWVQNGLFASSTSYFTNANFISATTSRLTISSASAGCAQFNALGQLTSVGIACGTNSATTDFSYLSNFGTVTAATTTPLWAQNGVYASSTSYFNGATTTGLRVGNTGTSLSNIVVGYCTIGNTTITASTTAYVNCTTNVTISTLDRVFVQATSSLPSNFIIQAASSTGASTINMVIYNSGSIATTATGVASINFWAAH